MSRYQRYAIYHSPPPGALADRAAAWLGWNPETGKSCVHPQLPGLPHPAADLTQAPRKYGFHATLRAPFRLAPGLAEADLRHELAALAGGLAPVTLDGLEVAALGAFLALRPLGEIAALETLAAAIVRGSNPWRAPLNQAEIARRRPERLSQQQRDRLDAWGYPYVFDQFRFHMTLTGPLPAEELVPLTGILKDHFTPVLPVPYPIRDICLFAERADGRFEIVARYPLSG